nr:MAG TPA: hypothetical protein [Caudoviricetes sp.]
MASIKINGVTYNGIFAVNLEGPADDGTTAVNRYVFVSGDPGSLEKEQSSVCINNICWTEKIGIVKIPLADGSGNYALFLRASETYDRTYRIAPGETIAQGDFVKLIPLYPRGTLYPKDNLYPNKGTLLKGLGSNSAGAVGVALASGSAGTRIKIYRPPA